MKGDCEFGERFAVVQSMLALLLQSLEVPSHGSGMCEGTGRCERHRNGETPSPSPLTPIGTGGWFGSILQPLGQAIAGEREQQP